MIVNTSKDRELSKERLRYITENEYKTKSADELVGRLSAQKRIDELVSSSPWK